MLVLTRKLMESIVIGGNIRITVTHVDRDRVKLGIEAPREIVVVREELLTKPAKPVATSEKFVPFVMSL